MTASKQRKKRQQRRRHHASQVSAQSQRKRRIQELVSEGLSPDDAMRIALIETVLELGPGLDGSVFSSAAEQIGYAMLWSSTFVEAQDRFAAAEYASPWRRLAAELNEVIAREIEDDGESAFTIAQRRMLDIARWGDYKAYRAACAK